MCFSFLCISELGDKPSAQADGVEAPQVPNQGSPDPPPFFPTAFGEPGFPEELGYAPLSKYEIIA